MIETLIKKEVLEIKRKIKDTSPIAIQLPEGLKQYSLLILDLFKNNSPILFVDPTYGACDLKDKIAKELNCKLLIHFGHEKIGKPAIKTIFVPLKYNLNSSQIDFVIKEIKKLNFPKINIATTTQYLDNINLIIKKLNLEKIIVEKSSKTNRLQKHMILGCNCESIQKNNYPIVFIGDGAFHPNNLAFINNKEIYLIDALSKKTSVISKDNIFIKKRYAVISSCINAKSFGILVSSKFAQNRLNKAFEIKKLLEKNGKKAFIFVSDYIKDEYLLGIKVDCFINSGCPRITYDDYNSFSKPLLAISEVELLFNLEKELKIDQI
ncbi:MAG: diphthamide biosynthesis enzyme Dph2 [archaeon]